MLIFVDQSLGTCTQALSIGFILRLSAPRDPQAVLDPLAFLLSVPEDIASFAGASKSSSRQLSPVSFHPRQMSNVPFPVFLDSSYALNSILNCPDLYPIVN
jgi:hypothetical protein